MFIFPSKVPDRLYLLGLARPLLSDGHANDSPRKVLEENSSVFKPTGICLDICLLIFLFRSKQRGGTTTVLCSKILAAGRYRPADRKELSCLPARP